MAEHVGGEGPDVFRHHVGAAAEERMGPRGLRERDGRAGRAAEGDERLEVGEAHTRGVARGAHQVHDVVHHLLVHVQVRDSGSRRENGFRIEQPGDLDLLTPAHAEQHFLLLVAGGIADPHFQHEAVELRLGQRVGPFVFDRVLGGEHEERLLERVGRAADGDLVLLHRLEERGLHLRGRPVDLVGEDDLREQRPLLDVKVLGLLVEDHGADQVGRKEVRSELDARERRVDDLRERPDRQGLGEPGNALEQDVAAGEQPDEQPLHHGVLADDAARDLLEDGLHGQGLSRLIGQLRHAHARGLHWVMGKK